MQKKQWLLQSLSSMFTLIAWLPLFLHFNAEHPPILCRIECGLQFLQVIVTLCIFTGMILSFRFLKLITITSIDGWECECLLQFEGHCISVINLFIYSCAYRAGHPPLISYWHRTTGIGRSFTAGNGAQKPVFGYVCVCMCVSPNAPHPGTNAWLCAIKMPFQDRMKSIYYLQPFNICISHLAFIDRTT